MCLHRMDDIQLCKEITRLKTELHKLVSVPGSVEFMVSAGCMKRMRLDLKTGQRYASTFGAQFQVVSYMVV